MQLDVLIMILDTYNYQIDVACLSYNVTIIRKILFFENDENKLWECPNFSLRYREVIIPSWKNFKGSMKSKIVSPVLHLQKAHFMQILYTE